MSKQEIWRLGANGLLGGGQRHRKRLAELKARRAIERRIEDAPAEEQENQNGSVAGGSQSHERKH